MIRSFFSILVILITVTTTAMAQQPQKNDLYKREWEQIDSLMGKGLPQSAAKIARQLLATAQQQKDGANAIKAQLFLMGTDDSIHENADTHNILRIDSIIAGSQGAEKALWQSINAEFYWQYFQRNRWQLYNRTPIAGQPPADIATWDAATLIAKASELYQASILDSEPLKAIPVEHYTPILIEGKNTRHLRPTLYDFLAFRAIAFFENDEKDIIRPAYQFQIEDALWFEPARKFSAVKVKPADPEALHFKALHTYQQVLAFHLDDEKPEALIDADLQRLAFVHRYSVHPDKDSLYRDALQQLAQRYRDEPAAAQAHYQLLQFDYDRRTVNTGDTLDLSVLLQQLTALIDRFPKSEGAANAASLRHTLTSKSLNLQTEEVALPGENSKALVSYRNLNKVYLRVYRWPDGFPGPYQHLDETKRSQLLQGAPVLAWDVSLPGAEDLYDHRTEVRIAPLPVGKYLLVGSAKPDFTIDSNALHVVPMQVSVLSLVINQHDHRLFALHRKLGVPIAGAQVHFWENRWDSKTSSNTYVPIGQTTTDESGQALIATQHNNSAINRITLATIGDTLYTEGYFGPHGRWHDQQPTTNTHTFLFTDRALYRPGQTVHFKGIVVENERDGNKNRVLPNRETEVTFYDANNQQVAALKLTTNAYGSFAGKFTAPSSGLTGSMRIETENGSAHFAVEEYKRPKFHVAFDTPAATIALNEEITVTGRAQAYAGNNIDGAEVTYRVVRHARFPYLWRLYRWGMPHSPEMEIANGTARTQPNGSFEVAFKTIPDKQISHETLPVFTYTVYADVTDINGETQSGVQRVHAGYHTMQLYASIAEQLDARVPQSLSITTQSLNGVSVSARVDVSVASLQFPGKLYRKRLWEKPDRRVMSETEFRQAFPDDEYGDEANYLSWAEDTAVWSTSLNTGEQSAAELLPSIWQRDGWHVITLKTTDAQGREIVEKKYTYVVDPTREARPQLPLLVLAPTAALEPGDALHLTVKTGFDSTYVWESNTDIHPKFTSFAKMRQINRPITQNDRGGLGYSWLFVYNNRVYTLSKHITVPWSDRDLQLEWATHRDKLTPGEAEEWRLTIKGDKKDVVAAELLAGLYEASLDALKPHGWYWDRLSPLNYLNTYWNMQQGFGISHSNMWGRDINGKQPPIYEKRYDRLFANSPITRQFNANIQIRGGMAQKAAPAMETEAVFESVTVNYDMSKMEDSAAGVPPAANEEALQASDTAVSTGATDVIPIRTNLQETAFFFPQLHTDGEGNVTFAFTMPEALTEWRLMAFAHTKDWKTGYLEGKVKTQKDLMVMPNLPRFLRQADVISIGTKISNLSEHDLQGTAYLELLDATTLTPVHDRFADAIFEKTFTAAKNQSVSVAWTLRVPENFFSPVVVRVSAKSGDFTDGEENTLPVITNRMLVTETLPLPVRGNESQAFTLPKLLNPESKTLTHHALTVEFTGNPAWYAVQALPYLMEYPYECAEQVYNRYYSTALAAHIVAQAPNVKAIFDRWAESDTAALLSNLDKNQELKSALLEETPWVMEAKSEREQKQRIALLFDSHKLAQGLQLNLTKLAEMQLSDGSFPWFKGMNGNRYITQYIATGIARLQQLGIEAAHSDTANDLLQKAVGFLDRQIKADHDALLKSEARMEDQYIRQTHIQYLYMRSFLGKMDLPKEGQAAYQYYTAQATSYWPQFNTYLKGLIALALHRGDDIQTPTDIIASLRETATQSDEMGMYWKSMPHGYWWYEAPIEAQALLIEAFTEIAKDTKTVDALKVWLLKQKQTQHWKTTKATADAIYALLLQGSDWLASEPVVNITLGKEVIRSTDVGTEAGTGYFKKRFESEAVSADMGNITVKLDKATNDGVAWGAVYWQYFENLDNITSAETPLSLQKQLYIERNTDRGPVLTEITATNMPKVGDKVKVRIELRVDRDMEYVHLKDMRAACFEPINVLSGYRYQGGLGYYESTRDVATNFFFDYLRRGTYIFEYPVFVSQSGDFSNGIATIQSMYAPEFSSHSEGIRVRVE